MRPNRIFKVKNDLDIKRITEHFNEPRKLLKLE